MKILVFPVLAAFALSSPGFAQETSAPAADTPAAADIVVDGEKEDPQADKVICKTERTVGSRLNTTKRCLTRRQWEAERAANRQDIERVQSARWKSE